jgi:murein DD-endopeptidase MepM/ murein hydrolase activator NlpD
MALRDAYPRPRLPTSHYFVSLARGENMRTLTMRPLLLWGLLALAPLLGLWSVGATLFIAFHDDVLTAFVSRQAEMQYSYEDRLAEARAELDRVTGRQLLDQNSFEGKVHDLLSRQAQLEQRSSIVASLAREAGIGDTTASIAKPSRAISFVTKPSASAPQAISAVRSPTSAGDSDLDDVKAYAPSGSDSAHLPPPSSKPRPFDEPRAGNDVKEHTSALSPPDPDAGPLAELSAAANNPDVAAPTRLSLISYSLDRMEKRQIATLDRIGAAAGATISRLRGVMAEAGVSSDRLTTAPAAKGGTGGPYIPVKVDPGAPPFEKAAAGVERELIAQDALRKVIPFMPFRRPLIGEAEVTSPFGYRADPFIGRPALHPGMDLVQEYGAPVKATGAGRVVHAGWMGGYGNMVEIDHGDGLVTRYGHLSAVLVDEGQEVEAAAIVGRIGSTGRSTGPHLHYEVRVDGEPVDPVRFLKAGGGLLASE